jgi:hypothetical protein
MRWAINTKFAAKGSLAIEICDEKAQRSDDFGVPFAAT